MKGGKRFASILAEAVEAIASRTGKVLLTALGAMLGVGSLVAISGLATTAGAQIVSRFDAIASTSVTVTEVESETGGDPVLEWESEQRLVSLNGVEAVASLSDLGEEFHFSAIEAFDPLAPPVAATRLQAASAGIGDVVGMEFTQGGMFDQGHSDRADRVALLGARAAERLGIADLSRQKVLFIDAVPYTISGIFEEVAVQPNLLSSVLIPAGTGQVRFGAERPGTIQVRTEIGSSALIAEQAPVALHASEPQRIQAAFTPEPDAVRAQISGDTQALFLVLGAVSLVGGAIGIMNTMLVSVLERRGEIGLRRAVGAKRSDIVAQFLTESAVVGVIGGVLGASVGTCVVVAVSVLKGWTPASSWWVPLVGVALGGVTGVAAGALPAWRASRIEPAIALRSS